MTSFTIAPRGDFSLAAAAGFGFAGSLGAPPFDGTLRLAFAVDGLEERAAVALTERPDGTIAGTVQDGAGADAIRRQIARVLSLDHDGGAWAAVGDRDPVIGRLQREHAGQRPVLLHSPYEAAAWAVISSACAGSPRRRSTASWTRRAAPRSIPTRRWHRSARCAGSARSTPPSSSSAPAA